MAYIPNHRGDTAYLTGASGVTAASYVYDAFGCLLAQSGIRHPASGICFSSKEWDPDAQSYYFGYRWYDPDTGTWTTKDPLGFGGRDINLYRMVCSNPLRHVDSYGTIVRTVCRYLREAFSDHTDKQKHANVTATATQELGVIGALTLGVANEGVDYLLGEGFNMTDMEANLVGVLQGYFPMIPWQDFFTIFSSCYDSSKDWIIEGPELLKFWLMSLL